MNKRLAKIIKSNSHIDYAARVVDCLDSMDPPSSADYGFGTFVSIGEERSAVGVIYNSQLINPEYGNFGPRLSPPEELRILSPDYLNECGVLLGILLLGANIEGEYNQKIPYRIIPVGEDVQRLEQEEMVRFHKSSNGELRLHYFSNLLKHAGHFAIPLIENIIEQLNPYCSKEESQRLSVLGRSLAWTSTFGTARF
jgi:hypothetical protein